jgi:hypothetical protein
MDTLTFEKFNIDSIRVLVEQYHLKDTTIAGIFKVTESAVSFQRRKHKVPGGSSLGDELPVLATFTGQRRDYRSKLTLETLGDMYAVQGLSDSAIGRFFGVPEHVIAFKRKSLGIPTISPRDRKRQFLEENDIKHIADMSTEGIVSEIRVHGSMEAVGKLHGVSKMVVRTVLRERGVKFEDVKEDKRKYHLTDLQQQLVIGGLLGDGGISKDEFRYYESHSIAQEKYSDWKRELLNPIAGAKSYETKEKGCLSKAYMVCFRTHPLHEFNKLYEAFYKFNKEKGRVTKTLPLEYISGLSRLSFSVWYFDDGTLYKGEHPSIFTGAARDVVETAVTILNAEKDLSIEIVEQVNKDRETGLSKVEGYNLVIHNHDNFWKLVSEYVPDIMVHKLPVDLRTRDSGGKGPSPVKDMTGLSILVDGYSSEAWQALPNQIEKEEWVDNIADYYDTVGFPYTRHPSLDEFKRVVYNVGNLNNTGNVVNNVVLKSFPSLGCSLAYSYFPNIFSVETNSKDCAYNKYKDSKKFKEVIRRVLASKQAFNRATLRNELRRFSSVSNFRPSVAKYICDTYGKPGSHLFDFAGGWSGRMIGCTASSRIARYVCTDVSKQTFYSLRKVASKLIEVDSTKKIEVYNFPSEDYTKYEALGSFDICFSSPPYFDTEKYSIDPEQSYIRYPAYKQWVTGYLQKTVDNCTSVLKEGGYLIINIADAGGHPLENDTYSYCASKLSFVTCLAMHMPSLSGIPKYEPIFVFRKEAPLVVPPNAKPYSVIKAEVDKIFKDTVEFDSPNVDKDLLEASGKAKLIQHERVRKADPGKLKSCLEHLLLMYHETKAAPTREAYKAACQASPSKMPYTASQLEYLVGTWTEIIGMAGIPVSRDIRKPVDHILQYAQACIDNKEALSPYKYALLLGDRSKEPLMKRLLKQNPEVRACVARNLQDKEVLFTELSLLCPKA